MIGRFSIKQSTPHVVVAATVVVGLALMPWPWWARLAGAVVLIVLATFTFDSRLFTEWLRLLINIRGRRHQLPVISRADRGALAMPGEDVAVRWEGDTLTALIALHPRPFTFSIVLNSGRTLHDDTVSTKLIEGTIAKLDVPLTVDVVSAGWRVARNAPRTVVQLYEQMIANDPCPAVRRTFLVVRLDPKTALRPAKWRGSGIPGVAAAAVSAATRLAEELSRHGVEARVSSDFRIYDQLTDPGKIEKENWSDIHGRDDYTTVFSAPGGPDQWWSVRADRTVIRTRLSVGQPPRSVVALSTVGRMKLNPVGWTRLRGSQIAGLSGHTPVTDTHWDIPIGSAGLLVGVVPGNAENPSHSESHVYLPLDTVDSVLHIADPMVTVQVIVRAAACGAIIRLPADPAWRAVAERVGASVGQDAYLEWPSRARTWLVTHRSSHIVQFNDREIVTERARMPITWIRPREEVATLT